MNEEEGAHLVGDMDELVAPQESTWVHGGQGKTYYCCGNLQEIVLDGNICQAAPQKFQMIVFIITSSASMEYGPRIHRADPPNTQKIIDVINISCGAKIFAMISATSLPPARDQDKIVLTKAA